MFTGFHDVNARKPVVWWLPDHTGLDAYYKDPRFAFGSLPNGEEIFPIQYQWEFSQVLDILAARHPRTMIEIGCHRGGSLLHFLQCMSGAGMAMAVDPLIADRPDMEMPATWSRFLPEGVGLTCCGKKSGDPEAVQLARELFDVRGVDFLCIDGDHTYAAVKADFELYGPLVAPGGLIMFHDIIGSTRAPDDQVRVLWQEIRQAGYVTQEIYSNPKQDASGIGLVYIGGPSA